MNIRLIARLDVKLSHLIKGVQMEGWRKMGNPAERAKLYYAQGADELLYMDVVASLYERNNLKDIVREVASESFVPITVGGGIRTLDSVKELLDVGADKVAINTAATQRPELLREISDTYGSQATVLSIEAKSQPQGGWEAMTDNGRNNTGLDVIKWAVDAARLGAGELLLSSIDKDGTSKGMDLALIDAVSREVDIPVIATGGVGQASDVIEGVRHGASAIGLAKALHTDALTFPDLRNELRKADINVRAV
ncbi:imidazole glycerol phosphate synthase subunit HisF [Cohaesibacter celericrescens]|uniref:Imidazole glycerol phosphate synthase subunit HisF n=1 Tax=Cohaesibacter celericrescens TaxID=2067669 RepID=A0A2N5XUF3_9HYPH|nr:imidazole glycerol phosphate synthase cyclase subunit [Cohaesibacter celericrescens]PLW78141.1 imidazole glycerol phosphate synthase subunit HisF [Cohaesibacter celericrescens]